MAARANGKIRVTQVERKTMDFDPSSDLSGSGVRCVRQQVRTERTVEADKGSSASVNDFLRTTGSTFVRQFVLDSSDQLCVCGHSSGSPLGVVPQGFQCKPSGGSFTEEFRNNGGTSKRSWISLLSARSYAAVALPKWWTIPFIFTVLAWMVVTLWISRPNESATEIIDSREYYDAMPERSTVLPHVSGQDTSAGQSHSSESFPQPHFEKNLIPAVIEEELSRRLKALANRNDAVQSLCDQRISEFRGIIDKKVSDIATALEAVRKKMENLQSAVDSGRGERESANVESTVRRAIEVYDADKTGMHDFALDTAGGLVLVERCSDSYESNPATLFGLPIFNEKQGPKSVIQRKLGPSTGDCWAFEGSSGRFTVMLSQRAVITAVSYEHLPACLSDDGTIRSSPKLFQVWGYDGVNEEDTRRILGEFEYLADGPSLQIFYMQVRSSAVRIVEFMVLTNYGSHYTCLYRIRVHGVKAAAFRLED